MKLILRLSFLFCCLLASLALHAQDKLVFEPKPGPGKGKHVVFLSGDEEYRSEEGLPMLAKILSQRHGFKCTVLFSLAADGTIDSNKGDSLSSPEALDTADAIVMLLRFRHWGEDATQRFEKAYLRGVPIIALRTSTHAFNGYPKGSAWEKWNYSSKGDYAGGFGKQVFGETWVTHWGRHKSEATRGIIEPAAKNDPILRGVTDVFGDSDVYEAYPPTDAKVLLTGFVLKGMNPTNAPAEYSKKRATDKQEQLVNNPPMPVAWARIHKNEAGKENKIFCTTLGAATDLQNEGLRRLVVNSVFWGLGLKVPAKADVTYVDEYHPTFYGFNGGRPKLKPADLELGKPLPPPTHVPAPAKK